MKELFLIKDNLANKISYYHLIFFMASLPFDRFYSHLILISFILHTLIQLNTNNIRPVFTTRTAVLQSVFFITLLSTIYTINRPEAFNEWGKQITIFLFPLLFCLNPFPLKKYRSQLLLLFSLVCTATILYLYLSAFHVIRHYQLPYSYTFSPAFTNHNFSEPIDIHATFFSMQVAIALVCMLLELIKTRSAYYRVFYAACMCILLAGIIQLSSKSVFIALFMVVNLAIPLFLMQGKKRLRYVLVTTSVSVLVIAGIFTTRTLKARYITALKEDLSLKIPNQTVDSRLDRWNAAYTLIVKSPIIGHGAGAEISLLQDTFFAKKYYDSYLKKLNAHSEYLSFLVKSGIIGLLVYISTLAFGFRQSLQKMDLLFFTFMLLVALVSFSENLLDVDKGIIFYAFFFSLFMFSSEDTPSVSLRA